MREHRYTAVHTHTDIRTHAVTSSHSINCLGYNLSKYMPADVRSTPITPCSVKVP